MSDPINWSLFLSHFWLCTYESLPFEFLACEIELVSHDTIQKSQSPKNVIYEQSNTDADP